MHHQRFRERQGLAYKTTKPLVLEQTLANRKRPDGTLYDDVKFPRGYWKAKDTQDNLDAEIQAKIRRGYPLTNTIFEDTRRAVLYQNGRPAFEADLTQRGQLVALLNQFFHYVYAVLYSPQYRERYAENLKRELPRIPFVAPESFQTFVDIGAKLAELHLNYEQAKEYPLRWMENKDVPFSWRVTRMKLTPAKDAVVVNKSLTLAGIPKQCFDYRLGNRSALEWATDQYQVGADKRSGITSDPNRAEDEEYIVRLIGKVVTVSVETVKLVKSLPPVVEQVVTEPI